MKASPLTEQSLFLQALELESPEEQAAFLDRACGDNSQLRSDVEELFHHHRAASGFLESPPTQVVAAADAITAHDQNHGPPPLHFLEPAAAAGSLGRLGHYEIEKVVGAGGFGVVLKARDTKLDRIVAVKTLAQSLATSAAARQRFVREARAAAAVKHDNVVGIHAVSDEGPVPFLVMEFISGVSLEEKLEQAGMLDLPAILRIGSQIASGLAAAHKQGLVHRDVKPANILLENGVERVKITDFGLARAANDATITREGEVAGTPQYMSPEQALGQPVDARSDLFSLGSVLYAMCTGRSPFRANSMIAALRRVCDDRPRPIRESNPEIPDWLVAIIDQLLAKKADQRFQTATEVADLLSQHLAQLQHPALPPVQAPTISESRIRNPKSANKRPWAFAAAAIVFLFIGVSLTEATGVTRFARTAVRIIAGEGTLVAETDADVQVTVEGDGGGVFHLAGGQSIRVPPSIYRVKAAKDGKPIPLEQEMVTIAKGDREAIKVKLEGSPAPPHGALAPLDAARYCLQVAQRKKELRAYLVLRDSLFEAGSGSQPVEVVALYREALRVFPDDGILHFHLGRVHARFGEWDQAIAAFARGLELAPTDHDAWFHSAPIYLAAGDQQGFRTHCRQMLDQFGQTKDEVIAERTAMTCMLVPDAIDLKLVESFAELVITRTEKHASYRYFTRAKGLAELRAGRPAEAIRWLDRFHPAEHGGPFDAGVFAALAMSHQALGHPDDAQAALAKSRSIVKEQMPNPAKGRPFDAWHDWLHAEILLREAEALLEKSQTTAP